MPSPSRLDVTNKKRTRFSSRWHMMACCGGEVWLQIMGRKSQTRYGLVLFRFQPKPKERKSYGVARRTEPPFQHLGCSGAKEAPSALPPLDGFSL